MEVIPNVSVLVQIANFVLLIIILNIICYRPIRKIMIDRKRKIQGFEESIEAFQRDSAESEQTFQTKIGEAKTKGFQEKESLKHAGQEEEKRLIGEISQKAQADLKAVRAQIAKDAEDARGKLGKEIQGFSAAIAEKILGRAVS